jgi:hypothetical protein
MASVFGCVFGEWRMFKSFLPAMAFLAGVACTSTMAFAYMAAAPVMIPPAFERPMSPYAACAAEAQESFLSGSAYESFMQHCAPAAVANFCDEAASVRKLAGKHRAAFNKKCIGQVEESER